MSTHAPPKAIPEPGRMRVYPRHYVGVDIARPVARCAADAFTVRIVDAGRENFMSNLSGLSGSLQSNMVLSHVESCPRRGVCAVIRPQHVGGLVRIFAAVFSFHAFSTARVAVFVMRFLVFRSGR